MNPIAQLIESINESDAVSVGMLFDKLMAEKLSEIIEDKKVEIAESIFMSDEDRQLEEEYEQLDELSKTTLSNYVQKANKERNAWQDVPAYTAKERTLQKNKSEKLSNGINKAAKRLTKEDIEEFLQSEEFEQLDELSKKTLASYVGKAADNMAVTHAKKVQKDAEAEEVDRFTNRHMKNKYENQDKIKDMVGASQSERNSLHKKTMHRKYGIANAVKRLSK